MAFIISSRMHQEIKFCSHPPECQRAYFKPKVRMHWYYRNYQTQTGRLSYPMYSEPEGFNSKMQTSIASALFYSYAQLSQPPSVTRSKVAQKNRVEPTTICVTGLCFSCALLQILWHRMMPAAPP